MDEAGEIAKYVFEAGMLKRVARSGWWAEKIKNPESVADHTFRTAVMAFVLARMEGCDEKTANRICTAAVFHDMHETRLLDLNKITARYITVDEELEKKVEGEQVKLLSPQIRNSIIDALKISDGERKILKDADLLECAFQAREYADTGYASTMKWLVRIEKKLQTKSAKMLLEKIKTTDSGEWREALRRDV